MPVNNAIGVSVGLAPPETGPTAVRVPLDFSQSLSARYDALSGQGSANAKYGYQTAFIDNSQNAGPVTVICDGTLLAYSVPGKSFAFLPIACPPGSLGITFAVAVLGAVVGAQLLDVPTPYCVWSALAWDTPAVALAPTDENLSQLAGTTSATAGNYTTLFVALPTRQGAVLYNNSADTLFLRSFSGTPGAGTAAHFRVPPNGSFLFPVQPKQRVWIRSTGASSSYEGASW